MKFTVGLVALVLASPVLAIAIVVWWKLSLVVAATVLGLSVAGRWSVARNAAGRGV